MPDSASTEDSAFLDRAQREGSKLARALLWPLTKKAIIHEEGFYQALIGLGWAKNVQDAAHKASAYFNHFRAAYSKQLVLDIDRSGSNGFKVALERTW